MGTPVHKCNAALHRLLHALADSVLCAQEEADIKSPIEQLAEGLKFVGDQLGKMWNGIGNFFKGAAANITRYAPCTCSQPMTHAG